jgi:hypothetical protein
VKLLLAAALAAFAMRGKVVERPKEQVKVKDKAGPAYFIPPGSDVWFVLKSTRGVEDGTKIRTAKTASLVLQFATGEARMAEQTTLIAVSTTTLDLIQGTVLVSSGTVLVKEKDGPPKPLSTGSETSVKAP